MSYFEFTPMSNEEIKIQIHEVQKSKLGPEGVYSYTITECKDQISKTDKPMFYFNFKFNVPSERKDFKMWIVKDKSSPWSVNKIKSLCESTGLQDNYFQGKVCSSDFINKNGKAKLIHKYSKEYGWQFEIDSLLPEDYKEDIQIPDEEVPF